MSRNQAVEREREERAARQAERAERLQARAQGVDLSGVRPATPFRKAAYSYATLDEAFPDADPMLERCFGSDVLVQIRTPRTRTAGGIIITENDRETDQWNTQVAKIILLGPACFRNRQTMELWPEGAWCQLGDYVRVPKYGGDRWWAEAPSHPDGKALFALFDDLNLKGLVPADKVLDVVAYI